MKKVVLLVLVLVVVLGSVGLIACGSKEEGGATQTPTQTQTPTSTQTTPPAGGGLSWGDMPVYPGANQLQKATWSIPPAEGEWTKIEWRYYETSGSVSAVADFYRAQLPAKGWEEKAWMEAGEVQWGYFEKNNEKDGAMVWISTQEGKTALAVMRATK